MASKWVDDAEELVESPSGTPFSMDGNRTYTKKFKLIANVKNVDPIEACLGPGVPRQWSPYYSYDKRVNDPLALLHTISAERESKEDWQVWIVTCQYSTERPNREIPSDQQSGNDPSNNSNGSNNNPEREMPEYEWDAHEENIAIPYDMDGNTFVNSALQPFKPAIPIRTISPVFIMTRNENNVTREFLSTYSMSINNDTFMGAPPGFCLCETIKAKMQFKGPRQYWRATYRLKFHWLLDPDNQKIFQILKDLFVGKNKQINQPGNAVFDVENSPFQTWILDQGVSELKQVNILGVPVPIPVPIIPVPAHPVLLDGLGKRAVRDPKTGQIPPTYLKFKTVKDKSFAKLFKNFKGP